ncbi:MAG TPA: hypothetical protein VNV41_07280 [Candidatus Acidoferrales bacterium]|nr:hypothetical protein [Candidatus Acidoferrales bacterium]
MAHQLTHPEEETPVQVAGGPYGGPPQSHTAIGVFDPPVPPKSRISPAPAIPRTTVKLLAALILVGLALVAAVMIWKV